MLIPVDRIRVGERARSLRPDHVKALADSIAEIGLRIPIDVVPTQVIEAGVSVDGYALVAGHHRLEAHKLLGLAEIAANVSDMSELDRQLWEIDENLMHAALNELERAEHLARRKDIYVARHPETRAGVAGAEAKHGRANENSSFASATAGKLGITERSIQQAVRRAERIDPEVKARIANTPIADRGVELDALAAMKPADQKKAVKMVEQGRAENIRDAKRKMAPPALSTSVEKTAGVEASESRLKAAQNAYNRLNDEERQAFHAWLEEREEPVFDMTRTGEAA